MIVKDKLTGKYVKVISYGPTNNTLRIIHSDGTIKIQLKSLLELPTV